VLLPGEFCVIGVKVGEDGEIGVSAHIEEMCSASTVARSESCYTIQLCRELQTGSPLMFEPGHTVAIPDANGHRHRGDVIDMPSK